MQKNAEHSDLDNNSIKKDPEAVSQNTVEKGQDGKPGAESLIYWLAAALLFAGILAIVLFFAGFPGRKTSGGYASQIVILGDSILGEYREEDSIADLLAANLQWKVLNGALGGTCLAKREENRRLDSSADDLSLVSLTKAFLSGDFRVQKRQHPEAPGTRYFEGVIEELAAVDLRNVQVLILEYGMNDYHNGTPMEDLQDNLNEYTFAGALRSSLKALKEAYPNLRILVLTPTYSWYLEQEKSCEEFNPGGGYLEEYVQKVLEVAGESGVESLDLYHNFYPHGSAEQARDYTRDGVHPNAAGREKIAAAISEYLEGTK